MPSEVGLWGVLPTPGSEKSPKQILAEQADALTDAVNRDLYGKVEVEREEHNMVVSLSIVAPALNHFEAGIVQVRHGVLIYPLRVIDMVRATEWKTCNNENEFKAELAKVLQAEHTKKVISSLLVQVRG